MSGNDEIELKAKKIISQEKMKQLWNKKYKLPKVQRIILKALKEKNEQHHSRLNYYVRETLDIYNMSDSAFNGHLDHLAELGLVEAIWKNRSKFVRLISKDEKRRKYPLSKIEQEIVKLLTKDDNINREFHLNGIHSRVNRRIDVWNSISVVKIKTHLDCLEELGLIEFIKHGSTIFVKLVQQ